LFRNISVIALAEMHADHRMCVNCQIFVTKHFTKKSVNVKSVCLLLHVCLLCSLTYLCRAGAIDSTNDVIVFKVS